MFHLKVVAGAIACFALAVVLIGPLALQRWGSLEKAPWLLLLITLAVASICVSLIAAIPASDTSCDENRSPVKQQFVDTHAKNACETGGCRSAVSVS